MDKPAHVLEFERPLRELEKQVETLHQQALENDVDLSADIAAMEEKLGQLRHEVYARLTPWQRVLIARHPQRPHSLDYVRLCCEDFQELHGDRQFNDDRALVGGTAFLHGESVMVIAQQKGHDTKENLLRNFGMPHPEGYRKALRLMKLAERFGLPVVTFIDTPGAFPGVGSEERHVSEAIAVNLREMSLLRVPTIAIVVGEGGSGGALGIGVTDRVLIFENSYYSVISPEGCAAILWKDRAAAPKAAEALKLSAKTLAELGVVDDVLAEPFGGAHHDHAAAAATLKRSLTRHLAALRKIPTDALVEQRYQRYRKLGVFEETAPEA